MERIANFVWTILSHKVYSLNLVSSDFHLFTLTKSELCGQHFLSNNAIKAATKQWITSTGDFYMRDIQALISDNERGQRGMMLKS